MRQITAHIRALLTPSEKKQWRWLLLLDTVVAIADLVSLVILLLTVQFYTLPNARLPWQLPTWLQNRQGIALIALVLLFFLLKNVLGYWVQKALHHFAYTVASRLSSKQLLFFLEGSHAQYATVDSAVQIKRISQHPVEFAHYLLLGLHQIIIQIVLVALALIALLWYQPQLFLLLLALLTPPILLVAWIIKTKTKTARTHTKTSSEKALQHLKEALAGYVESRVYQKKSFFTNRYSGHQQQLNNWLANLHSVQALSTRTVELFAVLGLFALIAAAIFTQGQAIDFLTVGAFLTAAYKIMPGMVKVLNISGQMKVYSYVTNDLLAAEKDFVPQVNTETNKPLQTIGFERVDFGYGDKPLLQGCYFHLQPGDFAGLQGISGQGKTTLLNLLLGFTEQHSGTITINGTATTAMQRQQYLPAIAYVKQQPFLLHDTIRHNIILSDEMGNETKLQQAIAASGLHSLIAALPQGLDTLVTENGKNISGGQRQRIAFARALYKGANLLLLDEPFSELDKAAEFDLLQHCRTLAEQGIIVLLITHNPQGLAFCNKTILLHATT